MARSNTNASQTMNMKTKKEFGAVFLAFLVIILFDQLPISQGKYWSSQRKENDSKQRGQFTELNHGHYRKCLPEMLEEVKMMAEDTCDAVYYHILCVYHNHGIIWQCKLNWWFILALVTGTLLIIGLLIICLVMGSCSR